MTLNLSVHLTYYFIVTAGTVPSVVTEGVQGLLYTRA